MSEKDLMIEIIKTAHNRGWLPIRLNAGMAWSKDGKRRIRLAPAGTPDLLLIGPNGIAVFVECKAKKNTLTDSQVKFQKKLTSRDHIVVTVWTIREVEDIFDQYADPSLVDAYLLAA